MKIDKTDRKILNALIDNSRLSLRQIGKKTGVSVATAMNRLNKLEKSRIVENFTAKVDYEKLGYDVEVIIEIRISKGMLLEVEKKIAVNPNVFAIYDVTGAFDAVILARFINRRQMDSFLKKIQALEFVERTETKLILQTVKEEDIKIG
jgi:DNA-binding Lrp family transcriptional regulator